MADALTGRAQRRQADLAAAAQEEQRRLLAEQRRRQDAVDAGQRRIMGGGGGGSLAFYDQPLATPAGLTPQAQTPTPSQLRITLGGAA